MFGSLLKADKIDQFWIPCVNQRRRFFVLHVPQWNGAEFLLDVMRDHFVNAVQFVIVRNETRFAVGDAKAETNARSAMIRCAVVFANNKDGLIDWFVHCLSRWFD